MHIEGGVLVSCELVQLRDDKLPYSLSSYCSSVRETGRWFVGKARFMHSFACIQASGDTRRYKSAFVVGLSRRVLSVQTIQSLPVTKADFFFLLAWLCHVPNIRLKIYLSYHSSCNVIGSLKQNILLVCPGWSGGVGIYVCMWSQGKFVNFFCFIVAVGVARGETKENTLHCSMCTHVLQYWIFFIWQ